MSEQWTRGRIEALGPTTDVPTAASIIGVSDWSVYEAIRRETWAHTRILRVGRSIKIPTSDLLTLLYPSAPSVPEPAAGGRLAAVGQP